MAQAVAMLVVLGGFGAVLGALAWLTSRARSGRIGGAFLGPLDEIYNPAAHRARVEVHEQAEHAMPMPSPDDQWPSRGS